MGTMRLFIISKERLWSRLPNYRSIQLPCIVVWTKHRIFPESYKLLWGKISCACDRGVCHSRSWNSPGVSRNHFDLLQYLTTRSWMGCLRRIACFFYNFWDAGWVRAISYVQKKLFELKLTILSLHQGLLRFLSLRESQMREHLRSRPLISRNLTQPLWHHFAIHKKNLRQHLERTALIHSPILEISFR